MKALAILLATLTLLGIGVATLFAWVVATFPWENTSPDDRHPVAFVAPGLVAFVGACLMLAWIALDRVQLAVAAFAVQLGAVAVFLVQALDESHKHDGALMLVGLLIELSAASAVAISVKRGPASRATPGGQTGLSVGD